MAARNLWRFHSLWLAAFLLGNCSYLPPLPDPSLLLAPSLRIDQSLAFQRALQTEPEDPAYQKARIDYLLEVISHTPYNFIRNGSRYKKQRAWLHLKWKYYQNRWQVKTAEEFINRVATFSKSTGQPYLIEFPDGRRYPLKPLFIKELERFDQELMRRNAPE